MWNPYDVFGAIGFILKSASWLQDVFLNVSGDLNYYGKPFEIDRPVGSWTYVFFLNDQFKNKDCNKLLCFLKHSCGDTNYYGTTLPSSSIT